MTDMIDMAPSPVLWTPARPDDWIDASATGPDPEGER